MPSVRSAPCAIGVSLKMYFGYRETLDWCAQVGALASRNRGVAAGAIDLFVIPSFPVLSAVLSLLKGRPLSVGAQDLFWEDRGAFTGEVSGSLLAELGCRYVEVGHAERRRLFGETDQIVALKVEAAFRNALCPIICVGEADRDDVATAARRCMGQVNAALDRVSGRDDPIIIAYEPVWAIGASEPAPPEHIRSVCAHLRTALDAIRPATSSRVIYGGTAGPGMLAQLDGAVDGLFLGRRVHDTSALEAILDEISATTTPSSLKEAHDN